MYFPIISEPSLDEPNKITFSIFAVAALMHLLRKQRDAVGLSMFSENVELHTQAKSSSIHHKYLIQELEKLLHPAEPATKRKTLAADALHQIAENTHKRSLVVIFSDMMESNNNSDELFNALQHLRYNKHEVVLFHVVDKNKELDFNYDNRPYKFIDLESGQEVMVRPNDVKAYYSNAINNYKNELKLKCGQYHIDFVEADINKGFKQILLPYLLKRERLY